MQIPHRLRLRLGDSSTSRTTATLLVSHPMINDRFKLRAQVRYVERCLADDGRCLVPGSTAIPAQTIYQIRPSHDDVQLIHATGLTFGAGSTICTHIPMDVSGRARSITIPTVSAKRTGL